MSNKTLGIPEQPFGLNTIEECIKKRNSYCLHYLKDPVKDVICSIESGIFKDEDEDIYKEITIINLRGDDYCTTPISIPTEYTQLVEKALKENVTFGSLIERENGWIDGSWQKKLTGKSREELIYDALNENVKFVKDFTT